MRYKITIGPLTANIRECWTDATNRRISAEIPFVELAIRSLVVETVSVDPQHQQQGHFKSFLDWICSDKRFDMAVVEGVQNPMLAAWLERHGWECDKEVMDFYWRIKT